LRRAPDPRAARPIRVPRTIECDRPIVYTGRETSVDGMDCR
jgi:hypothetical protein